MKTAYIFHDAFCDPYSDWYPWMKGIMEGMGYTVFVPSFPTPGGQSYESWKVVIKNYIPTFDSETVLIGHGTGGVFALRLVEESAKQIHGFFLVASYAEKINHAGYDRVNETFISHEFDWNKIKRNTIVFETFQGANDPFVPETIAQNLADHLGKQPLIIPEGGHINKASGFTQVVAIAQTIKESLTMMDKSISIDEAIVQNEAFQQPVGVTKGIEFTPPLVTPEATGVTATSPYQGETNSEKIPAIIQPVEPKYEVHTMFQDMSHLVNSNQGPVASSLLRKARADEIIKQSASPTSGTNVFYIVGSIIIILVGLGTFGILIQKNILATKNPLPSEITSLIQADIHEKIEIANKPSYTIAQSIHVALGNPLSTDTVRDIYYTNSGIRTTFVDTLRAIGITSIPQNLAAEFIPMLPKPGPLFMHGITSTGNGRAHFIVIPVNHYDTAFSGMKDWELSMFRDTGIFMDVSDNFLKTYTAKNNFQDEIIANHPVRTLHYKKPVDITLDDTSSAADASSPSPTLSLDRLNPFTDINTPYQENDVMISYFFLNDHTVIITDKPEIIPSLLKRYANSQIYH